MSPLTVFEYIVSVVAGLGASAIIGASLFYVAELIWQRLGRIVRNQDN